MNTDGKRRIELMPYINTVCLRTNLIHLWRIAGLIHLNNCPSKTRSHVRWEEGGVSKMRSTRGGGEEEGDHKSSVYWSKGYCFTDLLAQQCCECNHIAVIKHIPACWHFLKASLSRFPLTEELGQSGRPLNQNLLWIPDYPMTHLNSMWNKLSTNMCTIAVHWLHDSWVEYLSTIRYNL